jgi:hypothetical protein
MAGSSLTSRRSTGLLLAACWLAVATTACQYGTLTTWDSSSESGSETETNADDSSPNLDLDNRDESTTVTACLDGDSPSAGPAPARLLTSYEYANTVRDLVGYNGDITDEFPAENKVEGFENNVNARAVTRLHVRKYMKAAETIAGDVVANRLDELLPCAPGEVGEQACGRQFVEQFLRRAFRRPPTDGEIDDFVGRFEQARSEWGFETGIEQTLRAILQSPQFLYRLKPIDGADDGETVRLEGYELASRLSYLLWASTPDEELLAAAAAGELTTREQVERQVRRMLDDPRAHNAVYQFHRQWLHLHKLDSMAKDAERFPNFEASMTDDWKESLRKFVVDAYFGADNTLESFLTTPKVYLSDALAGLYDVETKTAEGMNSYRFEADQRSGLLTQPALMALLSNANQGSPIQRGVWVREQLLCQTIAPPPADANITPPDPDPDATTREKFRQHTADPQCAGCHQKIDPLGFGFEHYDGVGRYRETDSGKSVDASGELTGIQNQSLTGEFDGAVELAERLSRSREVRNCITSKWYTYAMGRSPTSSEKCVLRNIQQSFAESGGDFREMLVALTTSEAFRYRTVDQHQETP